MSKIGRPVAGEIGTTSSDRDTWFLGFSSGITTGVWTGRDDSKRMPELRTKAAPARIFIEYMRKAVADRPIERFDQDLKLPDWMLETDR